MSGPQAQPARASVAREPSAAQLRADATFAKTEGKVLTAFNTRKTNDGRPWAKVRWYELKSLQRDGGLAREIERMIGPLSPRNQDKELGELMTPEQFDLALTRTEHRNDAD